jgi:NAD+ kinase
MICPDPRNRKAQDRAEQLTRALAGVALPDDLIIVLGGDGHLLHVIHERGPGHRYLGLNCGRVGFLLNDQDDTDALVLALAEQTWNERRVPRLALEAETESGELVRDVAMNDIYLERASGQAAHLEVRVGGVTVVKRLVCDGVVVATSLGSTAYSMAAGGPACLLGVPMLGLTPIAPHSPRLPSLVLPQDSTVHLTVLAGDKRPVRAVCDGRDHPVVRRATLQDAGSDVRLCFLQQHHPIRALVQKLMKD